MEQRRVESLRKGEENLQKYQNDEPEVKDNSDKEDNGEEECSIVRQGNEVKVEYEPQLKEIPPNIRSMDYLSKFQSPETHFPPSFGYSFPYLYPSFPYFLPPKE